MLKGGAIPFDLRDLTPGLVRVGKGVKGKCRAVQKRFRVYVLPLPGRQLTRARLVWQGARRNDAALHARQIARTRNRMVLLLDAMGQRGRVNSWYFKADGLVLALHSQAVTRPLDRKLEVKH